MDRSAERQRELECGCSTWSQLQDTSWRCCVAWCSTMRSERCAACAKQGKRSGRISEREHVQRSGCRSERRIGARGAAGSRERTTSALGAPGAAGWTSPRAAARGARGRGARRPPAADARRSVGRSAFMVLAAARASRLSCGARDSCWDAWGRQRAPACSDMSRSSRLSSLVKLSTDLESSTIRRDLVVRVCRLEHLYGSNELHNVAPLPDREAGRQCPTTCGEISKKCRRSATLCGNVPFRCRSYLRRQVLCRLAKPR